MKKFENFNGCRAWFIALLIGALAAGCGGRDPILGTGNTALLTPTVTAVTPLANATNVPVNTRTITATFSKAMDPATLTANTFKLECPAGTSVPGAVTYQASSNVATLTLPAAALLSPNTICTATVTTGAKDTAGFALTNNFVWKFTTPDRPRVTLTVPATSTPGPIVPVNTAITAAFSKDMSLASISAPGTFKVCAVPCVTPVTGNVTYATGTKTATFTPATGNLQFSTPYTATITKAATDLEGIQLAGNPATPSVASDYVWNFTTEAADTIRPTVVLVNPAPPASGVCLQRVVSATFSEPMAPATIALPGTFTLTNTTVSIDVPGTVAMSAGNTVATFTPTVSPLAPSTAYSAKITTAATDVAGNALASDRIWTFTTGTIPCTPPVVVAPSFFGASATYAIAATAGVTNAAATTINGNVVLDPNATCNSVSIPADGTFGACNGFAPILSGTSRVASPLFPDAGVTSGAVKADLRAKYIALSPAILVGATSIPAGTTLGNSTGSAFVQGDNYFVPGVYQSLTSISITGDVTLDALGDANAVFVFQSSSTIGTPGSGSDRIVLINGAKASNVYWWAGSAATLGTNTAWQGNILAGDNLTMRVGATSCGRLFAGASTDGALVLNNNVVSVPSNAFAPPACQ